MAEPVDPEKFVDNDQTCVCGHPRDCHDEVSSGEPCLWGWPDPNDIPGLADVEPCPCENYEPEEDDRA